MELKWKEMVNGLTRCPTDSPSEQKECPLYKRHVDKCEYFQKLNKELLICKHLEEKGEKK